MRTTSESDETGRWLALSVVWMFGSLAAWEAVVWDARHPPTSGSALVLMALLVGGVSIALRLPVLTLKPVTTALSDQVVWLLACAANINWLGVLFLRSESLVDAVPALLLIATGEIWVHQRVARSGGLPWLRALIPRGGHLHGRPSASAANQSAPPAYRLADAAADAAPDTADAAPDTEPSLSADIARRSVDATDESGQRYLSGEIRVVLEPGQTSDSIVVGFCPAFAGTPTVQLECEVLEDSARDDSAHGDAAHGDAAHGDAAHGDAAHGDAAHGGGPPEENELTARLVLCTPAGMRVAVRRAAAAHERCYGLQWYATLPAETTPQTIAVRALP